MTTFRAVVPDHWYLRSQEPFVEPFIAIQMLDHAQVFVNKNDAVKFSEGEITFFLIVCGKLKHLWRAESALVILVKTECHVVFFSMCGESRTNNLGFPMCDSW